MGPERPAELGGVGAAARTLSGKKLEVPVKRVSSGAQLADALALTSVATPESLEPFVALARERSGRL